jgi:hypothetical protein
MDTHALPFLPWAIRSRPKRRSCISVRGCGLGVKGQVFRIGFQDLGFQVTSLESNIRGLEWNIQGIESSMWV